MAAPPDPYISLRNSNFRWYVASLVAITLGTQIQATVVAWIWVPRVIATRLATYQRKFELRSEMYGSGGAAIPPGGEVLVTG
jgi:hypothetical protein